MTFPCGHPRSGHNVMVRVERRERPNGQLRSMSRERCRECHREIVNKYVEANRSEVNRRNRVARAALRGQTTPQEPDQSEPGCSRCGLHGNHVCLRPLVEHAQRRIA